MNLWSREPIIPDVPADPNQELVDGIYREYPFGGAQLGVRSLIQLVVFIVLEMKKRGVICALFALGMAFAEPAEAQWRTIASCPGATALYPASATGAAALIDVNGNICISGTIATTPSGTQNVNLTQILGAAPSLTNPLWVFPATGATFPVSGTVSTNSTLSAETTKVIGTVNQGTSPWVVSGSVTSTPGGQYPSGAVPITITGTGTTGATTATLAAAVAKSTYICGFTITSDATAALAGTATVAGVTGGTMSFIQNVGGATAAGILTQPFNPCIPSSTTNTAIVITSVAAGTGGNTAVVAWGFQL